MPGGRIRVFVSLEDLENLNYRFEAQAARAQLETVSDELRSESLAAVSPRLSWGAQHPVSGRGMGSGPGRGSPGPAPGPRLVAPPPGPPGEQLPPRSPDPSAAVAYAVPLSLNSC
jgi:hypothetical protein